MIFIRRVPGSNIGQDIKRIMIKNISVSLARLESVENILKLATTSSFHIISLSYYLMSFDNSPDTENHIQP